MSRRVVIAVVGLPGSGKSTAARILQRHGYRVIELGDIWRELLKENGISMDDPMGVREFTRKLREIQGKDVYARYAYKILGRHGKKVAIMGMRSTYEMSYFKKRVRNMHVIAIIAPMKLRYTRFKVRGKPEDPKSFKVFKWLEQREKRGFMKEKSEEKHGVMQLIKRADYVVANTATIKRLEADLTEIVSKIR